MGLTGSRKGSGIRGEVSYNARKRDRQILMDERYEHPVQKKT